MSWVEMAGLVVGFGVVAVGLNQIAHQLKTITDLLARQVQMLELIKDSAVCVDMNVEAMADNSKELLRGRDHPVIEGLEGIQKEIRSLASEMNDQRK